MTLRIIGLQRTGTNYLETLLRSSGYSNFDLQTWKHSKAEEINRDSLFSNNTLTLIIIRHPIMWLESCLLNSSHDLIETRSTEFQSFNSNFYHFTADLYNSFYLGWLDFIDNFKGHFLTYESLLSDPALLREKVEKNNHKFHINSDISFNKVPLSLSYTEENKYKALNFQCSLNKNNIKNFIDLLDKKLLSRAGYSVESVSYNCKISLRSKVYSFIKNPEIFNKTEIDDLQCNLNDLYCNDGDVFNALGKWNSSNSQILDALQNYAKAIYLWSLNFHKKDISVVMPMVQTIENLKEVLDTIKNKALIEFRKLLENDFNALPNSACVLGKLDDVEERLGNINSAIKYAQLSCECEGSVSWHHLRYGQLLNRLGDKHGALKQIEIAISKLPEDPHTHFVYSEILFSVGRVQEAIQAALISTKNSSNPWFYHHLGNLYHIAGDYSASISAFDKATELEPSNANHWYRLSESFKSNGEIEKAINMAEHCISCPNAISHHRAHANLLNSIRESITNS